MAAYVKCTAGVEPLLEAINAQTDTWKIALSNSDPTAKTTFTAGTDDLATGNGYTAGGNAAAVNSSAASGGVYRLVLASPAGWTAAGGNIGPFRYAILWDTTQGVPIGFWDYGASITLLGANSDTFLISLDPVNGVFSVT